MKEKEHKYEFYRFIEIYGKEEYFLYRCVYCGKLQRRKIKYNKN